MRLPRMTILRWMIVVLLVAVPLLGVRGVQRRSALRSRAAWHAAQEARFAEREVWSRKMAGKGYGAAASVTYSRNQVEYHAALRQKYIRAARFPWLSVAPDPPPPE